MAKTPYDIDLDRNPANYQPLTPLGFLERAAAVFPDHTAIIHGPLRRNYAEFYARSRRLASALSKRGIKRGDTVSAMLANTPAMLEVPLRRADDARRAQHAQHKARRSRYRLLARSCRGQGRDRRPRIFQGDEGRAGALQSEPAGDRLRRSGIQRRRRAHRRDRVRRLSSRAAIPTSPGKCRTTSGTPSRSITHRAPPAIRKAWSITTAARTSWRRQHHHLQHAQASGLSVDAADVPLQRLVLSLVDLGGRRHACLPARGARGRDVRCDCQSQGDAPVRRADRDVDAAQRARQRKEAAAACGGIFHRRRAAAGSGARRHEGSRLQRHACLRADRDVRSRRRQRLARRMGRAAARRTGGEEGAPGRALPRARGARRARSADTGSWWRATARHWAK